MLTGRSARGDDGTMKARLRDDINLDGRVTARIVDRTCVDLGNSHDKLSLLAVRWDVKREVRREEKMLPRRRGVVT